MLTSKCCSKYAANADEPAARIVLWHQKRLVGMPGIATITSLYSSESKSLTKSAVATTCRFKLH